MSYPATYGTVTRINSTTATIEIVPYLNKIIQSLPFSWYVSLENDQANTQIENLRIDVSVSPPTITVYDLLPNTSYKLSQPISRAVNYMNDSFGTTRSPINGVAIIPIETTNTNSSSNPVCFLADAPVLTARGYRPISQIKVGNKVRTADGRDVCVTRVYSKRYIASAATNPYMIPKGQFGATEALPISPNHEVMVAGRGMVKAKQLDLYQMNVGRTFVYYNLELEDWVTDNLVVAGVEVESLAPVKRITMTREEYANFVYNRYGTPTAETLMRIKQIVFRTEDGRVNAPLFAK